MDLSIVNAFVVDRPVSNGFARDFWPDIVQMDLAFLFTITVGEVTYSMQYEPASVQIISI